MQKNENIINKYDVFMCISVFTMLIATAIQSIFFKNASLAILNLLFSIMPYMYILISKAPKILNKNIILIVILISIRVINSILSFNTLKMYSVFVQLCYDISFIINISSIYFVFLKLKLSYKFDFKYINYSLIISTIGYSIYNIIHNFKYFSYFANSNFRNLISFSSFFSNRNLFGEMLLITLFAVYYELDKKKNKLLTIVKYIFIFNLILSLSRTSIVSFVIFYIIKSILEKKYTKIILIFIIVLILLLINMFGIRDIFVKFIVRTDNITSGRENIWTECLNYFFESPIFGYGQIYISEVIDNITNVTSMHSWFLKILLTGGIINAFIYIIILSDIVLKAINIKRNKNIHSTTILPIILSLFAYGVFEEINIFEFGFINTCMTFFIIILPNVLYNQKREKENG